MSGPLPAASILRAQVNTLRGLLAKASRDDNNAESPLFYQMQVFLSELEGAYNNCRREAVRASPYRAARQNYRFRRPIRLPKNSQDSSPISPAEVPELIPEPAPASPDSVEEIFLESLYLECDESISEIIVNSDDLPRLAQAFQCERVNFQPCAKSDNWKVSCACGQCTQLVEILTQ